MVSKYVIDSREQFALIGEKLDGAWLDADKTTYNGRKASVKFFFRIVNYEESELLERKWLGLKKTFRVPINKACLQIRNVKKFNFDDTQKVGFYDLCEIKYNYDKKKVSLVTGIPLRVEVIVNSLDVILELDEVPYKWIKKASTLFGLVENDLGRDLYG